MHEKFFSSRNTCAERDIYAFGDGHGSGQGTIDIIS